MSCIDKADFTDCIIHFHAESSKFNSQWRQLADYVKVLIPTCLQDPWDAKLNTQDHGGKLSRELDWYCTHIVFGPHYTGKLESAYIVDPDAEYLSSQDLIISAHGNFVVENEKGGVEKVHVRPGIHPKLVTDDWVARVAGLAMMSVDGTMFAVKRKPAQAAVFVAAKQETGPVTPPRRSSPARMPPPPSAPGRISSDLDRLRGAGPERPRLVSPARTTGEGNVETGVDGKEEEETETADNLPRLHPAAVGRNGWAGAAAKATVSAPTADLPVSDSFVNSAAVPAANACAATATTAQDPRKIKGPPLPSVKAPTAGVSTRAVGPAGVVQQQLSVSASAAATTWRPKPVGFDKYSLDTIKAAAPRVKAQAASDPAASAPANAKPEIMGAKGIEIRKDSKGKSRITGPDYDQHTPFDNFTKKGEATLLEKLARYPGDRVWKRDGGAASGRNAEDAKVVHTKKRSVAITTTRASGSFSGAGGSKTEPIMIDDDDDDDDNDDDSDNEHVKGDIGVDRSGNSPKTRTPASERSETAVLPNRVERQPKEPWPKAEVPIMSIRSKHNPHKRRRVLVEYGDQEARIGGKATSQEWDITQVKTSADPATASPGESAQGRSPPRKSARVSRMQTTVRYRDLDISSEDYEVEDDDEVDPDATLVEEPVLKSLLFAIPSPAEPVLIEPLFLAAAPQSLVPKARVKAKPIPGQVAPEHQECFDAFMNHFKNWQPTIDKKGNERLKYRGGRLAYMQSMEQKDEWPSADTIWRAYWMLFEAEIPLLRALSKQISSKAPQ